MRNERDDATVDKRVSEAYRSHSTERVPDRLDRKILGMAADEAGQWRRGSRLLGAWNRPLAVAATVALSLAIVLQVTRLPDTVVPATVSSETLKEEFRPKDTSALDDARNQARLRDGQNRSDEPELKRDAAIESELRRDASRSSVDVPTHSAESAAEQDAQPVPATARPGLLDVAKSMDSLEPSTPQSNTAHPVDQVAADRAAGLEVNVPKAAIASRKAAATTGIASLSASSETMQLNAEKHCDDTRDVADEWLACIDALRLAGANQQADAEYEQFLLRFPDK